MTVSHGMNVEEVKALGAQLQQSAQQIRDLVAQLNGAVGNATWMGPDATTFKGTWWPEQQGHLNAAAEGLHGFGQSAINNANAQEQTSAS